MTPKIIPAEDLGAESAQRFVRICRDAIALRDHCTVALCGGSTPKVLYERLQPADLPWPSLRLFFGDERRVPKESKDSNYRLVQETLLDRIPGASAAFMAAAPDYEELLREALGPEGTFDLLLLGMGEDGHTASLFPGSPALTERQRWVVEAPGAPPVTDRITITPPVIWRARNVLILVAGAPKAERVREVLQGPPDRHPIQTTRRCQGRVEWLLDPAAASLL
ncbi:MAG: 6-phosphogluconolactonase [Cyanobacteria bacterium REEB65]|nr:6-phosphogluconolactonase [Cyanobacteria bacterium REEB65]